MSCDADGLQSIGGEKELCHLQSDNTSMFCCFIRHKPYRLGKDTLMGCFQISLSNKYYVEEEIKLPKNGLSKK